MAIACFGFVTFLPLRPMVSLPSCISFISRSTFLLASGEYLRLLPLFFAAPEPLLFLVDEGFFAADFEDTFAAVVFSAAIFVGDALVVFFDGALVDAFFAVVLLTDLVLLPRPVDFVAMDSPRTSIGHVRGGLRLPWKWCSAVRVGLRLRRICPAKGDLQWCERTCGRAARIAR